MLRFAIPANSQDKQVTRPFKGSFYAVDVPPYGNPQPLSISGNATHLGRFTGSMDFYKPPISTFYLKGTLIAANGDEIFFESYPILSFISFPHYGKLSGEFEFAGGTGRFNNCSGVVKISGVFNMDEDYAKWMADGWIKY